jgi:Contractile injection system tube protein
MVDLGGSALQKAMLLVVQGSGVPTELRFKYNPEQYSVEKSAEWHRPQASGAQSTPPPQYVSGNPAKVSMEIFFDAFEDPAGDVSGDVDTLFAWTKPCPPTIDNGLPQPPLLAFQWGASSVLSDFQGFLRSVSARYTMFRSDGTPVRATCSISLEEVPVEAARQNPTSGTQPGMRMHVLTEGESLHSVAWAEYGQARLWRALADFNGIDDPLRVPVGTTLLLPAPSDAAKLA